LIQSLKRYCQTFSLEESRGILKIVERRYKAATILAGQMKNAQYYELFPDPTIADAIMDRIIHNESTVTVWSEPPVRNRCAMLLKYASHLFLLPFISFPWYQNAISEVILSRASNKGARRSKPLTKWLREI